MSCPSPSRYATSPSCYRLVLPLVLSPQTATEPVLLQICIHSNWIPPLDRAIHLARDSAVLSPPDIHDPPDVEIAYPVTNVWRYYQDGSQDEYGVDEPADDEDDDDDTRSIWLEFPESNILPRRRFSWTYILAVLGIAYVICALKGYVSHPAWVIIQTTASSPEPSIWQPIDMIYNTYEDALMPLFTHWQHPSLRTPLRHHVLHAALLKELQNIQLGLASWRGTASIPGPDPSLVTDAGHLVDELKALQRDFDVLFDDGHECLGASLANGLLYIIDRENSTDIIRIMDRFWTSAEFKHGAVLQDLNRLYHRLNGLDVSTFLQDLKSALSPYQGRWTYQDWITTTLDAANFIRKRVLPTTEPTAMVVSNAIKRISALNSSITSNKQFWSNRMLDGADRSVVCEFMSSEPRWWTSWVMGVTSHHRWVGHVSNESFHALRETARRGNLARVLVSLARFEEEEKGLIGRERFRE
ncbi:Ff.00g065650.m01.CDS01 [Fusarium sp. VM40]|nr:Ff.00g065650.m01.CDS01 [Fusarium sp. VM40]